MVNLTGKRYSFAWQNAAFLSTNGEREHKRARALAQALDGSAGCEAVAPL